MNERAKQNLYSLAVFLCLIFAVVVAYQNCGIDNSKPLVTQEKPK